MSDFVLTIESDDEEQQQQTGVPSKAPAPAHKRGVPTEDGDEGDRGVGEGPKRQKVTKREKKGRKNSMDRKGKGRGQQMGEDEHEHDNEDDDDDDDQGLAMDNDFQFDGLGGGQVYSSRGATRSDAWDLDKSADLFRRKNAIPRVTVDEIIARRKARMAGAGAGAAVLGPSQEGQDDGKGEDEGEGSEESEDSEEYDDDEGQDGSDVENGAEGAALSEDDDRDENILDEDEDEQVESDQDGADEDEDDDEDDDDGMSPFAKLANAAASLSDDHDRQGGGGEGGSEDEDEDEDEDEAINFTAEADRQVSTSTYFTSAPKTATSHVTSNSAASSSSTTLPPFSALPNAALSRPIILGLNSMGLTTPTPVQAQTIPVALLGKDIVGSSITGSGKTVAFWVGVLERLLYRDKKDPRTRVVVICPTRELAVQVHNVGQAVARYTDIRFSLCVGGLSLKAQEAELKTRPDVVVSTPGRLIDHVRNTPSFDLDALEILIIDEADRILEEGFKDELQEIIDSCPRSRQTMLFSATITEDIRTLARLSLHKPVRIAIDASQTTSNNLMQEFVKLRSTASTFREATLVSLVKTVFRSGSTIIFFRSKASAHRMKILFGLLGLSAEELHGDLTQEMRMNSLKRFREGQCGFLLATDLASRGLDIKGITSVINYEMPKSFDIYLHRVGRTARAGRKGRALTLVSELDRKMLKMALKSTSPELVKQTTMPSESIKETLKTIEGLQADIQEILAEEREEKELRKTEMQITKGQNLLDHAEEIHSRPARTWFQTGKEKETAKEAGKKEWNEKMGDSSSSSSRPTKPLLNHKQKRRAAALAELEAEKSANARFSSAIKNAKKAFQPGAIRQMGGDDDKRHLIGKNDKKKKKKKTSGFKEDLGDKKKAKKPDAGPASSSSSSSNFVNKGKSAAAGGPKGKSRSSTSKKPFKK